MLEIGTTKDNFKKPKKPIKSVVQCEPDLSQRELDCCYRLCLGLSHKSIGRSLGISARTVDLYIERAKNKMRVQRKHELILKLMKMGIVEQGRLFEIAHEIVM